MFTNALLGFSLLLAAVAPPDTTGMPIIDQSFGKCPDGSVLEIRDFDSNPQNPEASIRVFLDSAGPIAALIFPEKQIYVYAEQRYLTLDEMRLKYPSPCDIPHKSAL